MNKTYAHKKVYTITIIVTNGYYYHYASFLRFQHSLFHTRKRRGSSDSDTSGIRVRRVRVLLFSRKACEYM